MSQREVDFVRTSHEHFARTGQPYLEGIHDAIEVFDHDIPDASNPYRDLDGIAGWLADFAQGWDSYELELAMVWTFEGGRLVRIDYFNSRDLALRAVGLESG